MGTLLDELLALRVPRAGGVAWEYYFTFGGGRPPWVSGLAQGTGIQSIARVAQRTGRKDEVLPIAGQALGVFETPTPEGVRVATANGAALRALLLRPRRCASSTASCRRSSASTTSAGSATTTAPARSTPTASAPRALELPTFDTGAWSLYSRGSIEHESDLSYHQLLRAFLRSMCTRTEDPVYCDTELRFAQYELEPPQLSLVTTRLRGGTVGKAAPAAVEDLARRAAREARRQGRLDPRRGRRRPRHAVRSRWTVPRKAGDYDVTS